MSVEAISWALSLDVDRSSAKFVLVAMANCANADMTCWPSIQYLSDATCQDRKTVLENIKRLKAAGLIIDTEMRKGTTAQVPVYILNNTKNGTIEQPRKRNSPENGTVPKTDGNSPVFPSEQSRFSVATVPKTDGNSPENGTRNRKEPSRNRQGTQKESSPEKSGDEKYSALDDLASKGIDRQIAKDWLAVRKAKKLAPVKTAIDSVLTKIESAGLSANSGIRLCCERGWGGFEKKWLENAQASGGNFSGKASRHAGFENLDYSEGVENGRIV